MTGEKKKTRKNPKTKKILFIIELFCIIIKESEGMPHDTEEKCAIVRA